ncbi:MAG: hypothetical protein KME31_27205 [Tolypothrix carrinoi HA7290-LM1]|nr:hypothetical protein [Tolypothrix carrinoi HA7290-LM1]
MAACSPLASFEASNYNKSLKNLFEKKILTLIVSQEALNVSKSPELSHIRNVAPAIT